MNAQEVCVVVTRPAVRVQQGNLVLYATSLRVKDLKAPGFYTIDTLDPGEEVGFQRLLDEKRAKRLAEYLLDADQEHEAFLPTSLFLATEKVLPFDDRTGVLTIDTDQVGPLNVVDGQHRISGLVLAAGKAPDMNDFEIPVNIAVGLDPASQMCHFLIVNTTQKAVDKAIEQQIIARLTGMINFEKTPILPRWIRRQVEKGEDYRALEIIQYLNTASGSPWKGKILMANPDQEAREAATVNQGSFVTSLKKLILVPSNPISGPTWTVENQQKVLLNYWAAIDRVLADGNEEVTVLFKTNGLHLFHAASPAVFLHLANQQDFKQDTIVNLLRRGFDNLSSDFLAMGHSEFWYRGGAASGLNQGALRKYAQALAAAINTEPNGGGIQF